MLRIIIFLVSFFFLIFLARLEAAAPAIQAQKQKATAQQLKQQKQALQGRMRVHAPPRPNHTPSTSVADNPIFTYDLEGISSDKKTPKKPGKPTSSAQERKEIPDVYESRVLTTAEVTHRTTDRDVATEADAANFWNTLNRSSEIWTRVNDSENKYFIVEHYIDTYRQAGIAITKPPEHYTVMIDDMIYNNPSVSSKPFSDILRIVAVMEYDFNNGQNKDTLARQLLGEKVYLSNRARLKLP